jgi:hypothetical protein
VRRARNTNDQESLQMETSETGDADDYDKRFQTLGGFLAGEEPEEPLYFAYSATLRIFGTIPNLNELTRSLAVHSLPSAGGSTSHTVQDDMWNYIAPVNESGPLHVHIDSLWNVFRERKEYLLQIKNDSRLTSS